MRFLVAALTLMSPIVGTQGSGDDDLAPTPTYVRVTAEDPIRGQITECLSTGLEQTPGVVMSNDASALTLDVIVTEQKLTDGSLMGYLIYTGGYLPGPADPDDADVGENDRAVVIQWQTLRMARPDLDLACATIVEGFRTEVIEPVRAELERIRSMSPIRTAPKEGGE